MSKMMVVTQPTAIGQTDMSSDWSDGLCDCTKDLKSCCLGFWCYSCFTCLTTKDADECTCLPLLDGCPLPPITLALRTGLRHRYGIKGDICDDCVMSFFCRQCVWCQMAREIKARREPITLINTRARQP